MELSTTQIADFQALLWNFYADAGREMPWRQNPTPYWVLVSEIMLQQTQVSRVLPKFAAFVRAYPSINSLAKAPLSAVLELWSGLGYNRRAKFLHLTARAVVEHYDSKLPTTQEELLKLPGIGPNTAGAIRAYAFNEPAFFIETNIRTVYLHHFFTDRDTVGDREVRHILEQTIDREHPREWYWALMDYGTYLKQAIGNNTWRSKHYTKQSRFVGSKRQLRGKILKFLLKGPQKLAVLETCIDDARTKTVIDELIQEGFIEQRSALVKLTDEVKLP